ncbi:CIA30 family protein [Candidatus Synechococcus calcipolaris G9]|uniref:CIA30 family protein n=1 Tax=Candidatus Synechococcus calcipolaris G9 TaxID=1497997 RepID=A0ABT6F0P4_9SYNE|nr:CIA30 family protein [Candidatus Synechococcus calcipolaris]MDG2991373.1 CIA30 family protein [Candidatus Synechococcus calcipolaris G9]
MTSTNNAPWDIKRFAQTLAYFETLPFIGNFSGLLSDIRAGLEPFLPLEMKGVSYGGTGLILVLGATGGTGRRLVKQLLGQGYGVRALVRDRQKAEKVLPHSELLEIVTGDVTEADSLPPELMTHVRTVISCLGTIIRPVEPDPDEKKYAQGIKFYPPQVVGPSPEQVEYQGVKAVLALAVPHFAQESSTYPLFDYRYPSPVLGEVWGALDDVVMGGVSESGLRLLSTTALFTGTVSTANSGGFVSIRTRNLYPPLNLVGYQGIALRVKGDGQRYKFFLRSEEAWDGVGYAYSFNTVADEWITVQIPFRELTPVFRARTLPSAPPLNIGQIHSLQLMLSKFEYDGNLNPHFKAGLFALEIESIAAYGGPDLPRWIMVSSAGVTRPGRSDLDLAQQPPAVKMNDQLGGILTWKLAGENAVRESGLPYTILRPCALTEEPGDRPLQLAQGDRLTGKINRDDLVAFIVSLINAPQTCGRTVELAEATAESKDGGGSSAWASQMGQFLADV